MTEGFDSINMALMVGNYVALAPLTFVFPFFSLLF
uniref:Uncharacterized protein n=1 Tax=Rhizophora mucronata TaxID=61149 RepID=A0A2P2IQT2_RHIMU